MKIGVRTLGGASLKIAFCAALPHLKRDLREITNVYCDPDSRNQGLASQLMESICKEADAKRMVLILTVDPYGKGGLDKKQLEAWYCNRFYFNPIQQEPLLLARVPFPKQVAPATTSSIILTPGG